MHEANRMKRLPLYLFTIIDALKEKAQAEGKDVIDLGMGNPDLPTPPHVVEAMKRAVDDVANHRYSRPGGDVEKRFGEAVATWYKQRFDVDLDPATEVLPLIGSKEGIAHLSLAYLNNDDIGLIPNPAYPVHGNGVIMAGGILYNLPIGPKTGFLPELESLSPEILRMAKILIVGYPHNPTATCVDLDFYENLVDWAKDKELIVCSDLAYSDIVYDGYKAPSLMQVKGAKDLPCIEFHTCSKSYNMAGWRIAWAVGNADVLKSLAKTKSYIDFGSFRAVQEAAIEALTGPQDCIDELVATYKGRRDVFVNGMRKIGWDVPMPKATFYIWSHIPPKFAGLTSLEFCKLMVEEAGVVAAPGSGFGEHGDGFVRFALVEPEDRLEMAVERLQKLLSMHD